MFSMAVAFLVTPQEAKASILTVNFTPNPLFNSGNFLPKDEVTGTVEVSNTDTINHEVLTEAINVSDNNGFGDKLHLVVKDASNATFFDGGFGSFLTNGVPTTLGTILPAETRTFTYTVSFLDTTNDNSYQGKTLGFDLCVGFAGGASQCGDTQIGPEDTGGIGGDGDGAGGGGTIQGSGSGGGGGGGGGGSYVSNLQINNEETTITNPEDGEVVIEWDTNFYATSQVIYGPASGTYVLDLTVPYAPFYGYPSGTTESTIKVIHHVVTLSGLTPGEIYKYRVVSRASPPTISFERQFTVAQGGFAILSGSSPRGGAGSFGGSVSGAGNLNNQSAAPASGGSAADDSTLSEARKSQGADATIGSGGSAKNQTRALRIPGFGSNLAATLTGIPAWLGDNLDYIAYAAVLFGIIHLLRVLIARGRKKNPV